MRSQVQLYFVIAAVLAIPACSSASETAPSDEVLGDSVGTVNFPVECKPEAAAMVERGVALMHHMTYASAKQVFQEAAAKDPECAMALWGVAMTDIHPLWQDRPSAEMLTRGAELTAQARSLLGTSERERAYVETVGAYFDGGDALTEEQRLERFEAAWARVREAAPDDLEAAAFYALAHLALADPGDKTYEIQRAAGAIAEEVLAAAPDHPGAHHYIIHAYDYPPLAQQALPVARTYGKIAPDVPHALHMTSHIFTRLGLWDDSIEWNRRSEAAAWKLSESLGAVSMHYQHALDYLVYAYLQKAMDEQALEVAQKVAALKPPFHEVNRAAAAHAFSAIPARYAVERRDWVAAAALEPRLPAVFPWDDGHLPFVAVTHFARALGMAHQGDFDGAVAEVATLQDFESKVSEYSAYWAKQIEIQKQGAQAWITFSRGEHDGGLQQMRAAALLEATTEKAPVTPGELVPAAELLGDMLLEQEHFQDAIVAYDTALARSPGRFNSLYGAGLAAERMGDVDTARDYYGRLVETTAAAGDGRPRLVHAREVVASR